MFVEGNGGRDTLKGGDGSDIIAGGASDDMLWGGEGADTFVFAAEDGVQSDVIKDFELSVDMIGLSGLAIADITESGSGALVTFDNGSEALIRGIDFLELSASDDFSLIF